MPLKKRLSMSDLLMTEMDGRLLIMVAKPTDAKVADVVKMKEAGYST